jgi:hypothetical protein
MPPRKKITASALRQAVAIAKSRPLDPARGRTIAQNIRQSLQLVQSVPATEGTGLCNQKGNL